MWCRRPEKSPPGSRCDWPIGPHLLPTGSPRVHVPRAATRRAFPRRLSGMSRSRINTAYLSQNFLAIISTTESSVTAKRLTSFTMRFGESGRNGLIDGRTAGIYGGRDLFFCSSGILCPLPSWLNPPPPHSETMPRGAGCANRACPDLWAYYYPQVETILSSSFVFENLNICLYKLLDQFPKSCIIGNHFLHSGNLISIYINDLSFLSTILIGQTICPPR